MTKPYDENGNRTDLTDHSDILADQASRFMYWRFVRPDLADEAAKEDNKFGVTHPGSIAKQ